MKLTPEFNKFSRKIQDEIDAFKLFISNNIIDSIVQYSSNYGVDNKPTTHVVYSDLKKWMAINLYFGLIKPKNMNLEELWNDRCGPDQVKSHDTLEIQPNQKNHIV